MSVFRNKTPLFHYGESSEATYPHNRNPATHQPPPHSVTFVNAVGEGGQSRCLCTSIKVRDRQSELWDEMTEQGCNLLPTQPANQKQEQ